MNGVADVRQHQLGVYRALRARIELINQSIGHSGTQGAETEEAIRQLLIDFLPSDFGVGSGVIVGTNGRASRQVDIVIYDRSRPDYTLSSDSKIFLADHVLAAIEIKTTFSSGKNSALKGALENIASVRRLPVCKRPWVEEEPNPQTGDLDTSRQTPTQPLGIVFFFGAGAIRGPINLERHFKILSAGLKQVPLKLQPDLMFSLAHGSFFRHFDIAAHSSATEQYSCALVQMTDDRERVVTVDGNLPAKAVANFNPGGFAEGHLASVPIQATGSREQIVALPGERLLDEPVMHRVATYRGKSFFIDAERAFLTFISTIDLLVRLKRPSRVWKPADYFGQSIFASSAWPGDLDEMAGSG